MKKKLSILIASAALLALAVAGCGQTDTAAEPAPADQETGMQIASAWLVNEEAETRTSVTIDLSGGWSVEFASGAFYLYENMQSRDDESSAMGVSLSKEVYDEYLAEARQSDSYTELDNAVFYTDILDESVYLFTDGVNGYFRLSVKPDLDSDAVFQRVSVEAESGGQTVGYGQDSQLYTPEEMDAAVGEIMAEFDTWTGCAMNAVTYAGDDCNTEENIQWLNSLKEGANYTQCIEFLTDFHSPVNEEDLKETAWEPDTDYTDYQWWLARAEGGQWELVSWGY